MLVWGMDEGWVSAGHVGGTRGSGIVSGAFECGAWDVRSRWSM